MSEPLPRCPLPATYFRSRTPLLETNTRVTKSGVWSLTYKVPCASLAMPRIVSIVMAGGANGSHAAAPAELAPPLLVAVEPPSVLEGTPLVPPIGAPPLLIAPPVSCEVPLGNVLPPQATAPVTPKTRSKELIRVANRMLTSNLRRSVRVGLGYPNIIRRARLPIGSNRSHIYLVLRTFQDKPMSPSIEGGCAWVEVFFRHELLNCGAAC